MMVIQNRDFTLKELGLRLVLMDGRPRIAPESSVEVSDFKVEGPKRSATKVGPKKGHKNVAPELVTFASLLSVLRAAGVTLKTHSIRKRLSEIPGITPRWGWYNRAILDAAIKLGLFERRANGRPKRPWRKPSVSVKINT